MLPHGIVLFPHLQTMEVLSLASVETAGCAAVVVGQKRFVLVVLLPPPFRLAGDTEAVVDEASYSAAAT